MEIKYPDYTNSLVNLASSILKNFGAVYRHPTLPAFDRLLSDNYKNVVVLLFDGMGVDALSYHLTADSFLRKHLVTEISSVFPSTTTAATITIESGITPAEHGWIGWTLYFKELDKLVNIFPNTVKFTQEPVADYHVAGKLLPYNSIINIINETGNAKAYSVSPFGTNKISTIDELFNEVISLCRQEGRKYIYSYWDEPDATMHMAGCYDNSVGILIKDINDRVEKLCRELEDTLVIVTSDHGLIDTKYRILTDYPELLNMIKRPPSIENRAACFYVKEEYQSRFADEFYKAMGDDFLLMSKEDIKKSNIFGYGNIHPKFEDFIGDFIAIATAEYGIVYSIYQKQDPANHAGLTTKEMLVPFIAIEK